MATGTVKWFSDEQAFGFITPDDSGNDLFVFHSAIHGNGFKPLSVGAKVSYDAEQGPEAANVPSAGKAWLSSQATDMRTALSRCSHPRAG